VRYTCVHACISTYIHIHMYLGTNKQTYMQHTYTGFQTPIDEEDAAARILDPVLVRVYTSTPEYLHAMHAYTNTQMHTCIITCTLQRRSWNHKSCSWTALIHSFANSPLIHALPPFWHTCFATRRKTKASATQDVAPHPFWVCKLFPSLSRGKIGDLHIPQKICRSQWGGQNLSNFWHALSKGTYDD